jgi:hypothetical protein
VNKIPKSKDTLAEEFVIQMKRLADAARLFDEGSHYQACQMATVLRLMFRETKSQKSLLGQLDLLGKILILSTSTGYSPTNLLTQQCLLNMNLKTNEDGTYDGKYFPPFDDSGYDRWISTNKWWKEIVLADGKKNVFTREKIVLYLSDQDGGVHVDPALDEPYHNLKNNNSMAWLMIGKTGDERPLCNDPAYMTVRQICYEFMASVARGKHNFLRQLNLKDLYLYDKTNYL